MSISLLVKLKLMLQVSFFSIQIAMSYTFKNVILKLDFCTNLTFSYRLTYNKDFLNAKAWYMVFILQIMQFKITSTAAGPGAVVVLREYFKQSPKGQQLNLKLIRAWKTFVRKMRGLG